MKRTQQNPQKGQIGVLVLALLGSLVGIKLIVTGTAGPRFGYEQGLHVKIAGFGLLIVGIYMFVKWVRGRAG